MSDSNVTYLPGAQTTAPAKDEHPSAPPCHSTRRGASYRGGAGVKQWTADGVIFIQLNDGDEIVTFDHAAALAWMHALADGLMPDLPVIEG